MKPRSALALLALFSACNPAIAPTPSPLAPPPSAAVPNTASAPPPQASAAPPAIPASWLYPVPASEPGDAKGMVTSDAALATKVGADVLASGGDAVEAAIATAFALAVVHPTAGNLGGGGFLVARVRGEEHALDFREKAPGKASHDMFKGKDGKPTEASRIGALAAGVPGTVAGMFAAYEKLAGKKKTWAELVAPSIKLARDGFIVGEGFAKAIAQAKVLKRFPASVSLFLPGGAPPAVGSTWKDPELAATLQRIADKGAAGFYEGVTAELVEKTMKREKGVMSAADLKAYDAKWRAPITFEYRGRHVVSMPPPSGGGVVLGMLAHELSGYELGKLPWHSPEHLHLVMEAMRRAFLARNTGLGDPDFVKNPIDELLSDAWAAKQRASIKLDRASTMRDLESPATTPGADGPHTTHYSVTDAAGNAVAVTTTLNDWFGCGVTVEGAGFVLNDEMDDFAAVPGMPNMFGLVQGESNAVAPGKRMLSSMSPTLVTRDGKIELVLGAAGGPTITTAVFQILSNVVDFGQTVTAATYAPRIHQQDSPDSAIYETDGLSAPTLAALRAMGHEMVERTHLADAPSIGRALEGGAWIGVAEPRRLDGLALGP